MQSIKNLPNGWSSQLLEDGDAQNLLGEVGTKQWDLSPFIFSPQFFFSSLSQTADSSESISASNSLSCLFRTVSTISRFLVSLKKNTVLVQEEAHLSFSSGVSPSPSRSSNTSWRLARRGRLPIQCSKSNISWQRRQNEELRHLWRPAVHDD